MTPATTQWGPNGADTLDATSGNGWVAGVGVLGQGGNVSAGSVFPAQDGVLGLGRTGGGNRGGVGVERVGWQIQTTTVPVAASQVPILPNMVREFGLSRATATLEILMETSMSPVLFLPQ